MAMNETFPTEQKPQDEKLRDEKVRGEKIHAGLDEAGMPARPTLGLTWLALLLALVSLAGTGWLWWQGQGRESATADLSAEAERQSHIVSGLEDQLSGLESRVAGMASADPALRLGGIEQELKSLQAQADSAKSFQDQTNAWTRTMQAVIEGDQSRLAAAEQRLAAVSTRNLRATEELDLAEVDYLLRMAQERLVLFGDSRTAAQALLIAGEEVQAFDNPVYLGLSREIALAQQRAAGVITPDFPALYGKLDGLQVLVGSMPLKGADVPEAPASEEATGWWSRLRNAFTGLVTVRRTTALEDELPLLADQALVRQQAWLELEVARLAAMRRDGESWKAALDRITTVLERWFDPAASGWSEAVTSLDTLKALDIDPELPDISAPLKTLQAMRAASEESERVGFERLGPEMADPGMADPGMVDPGIVDPEGVAGEAAASETVETEGQAKEQ